MNVDLNTLLSDRLVRPKVVHSLPGRLRMFLPLLKRIGSDAEIPAELISEIIDAIPGVERLSVNALTGTILIEYDRSFLSEKHIVSVVITLGKTAITYRDRLTEIDPARRKGVLQSVKRHLAAKEVECLASEASLELPNEIWS